MSAKAARGHRPHVPSGRRQAVKVYLSGEELAVIEVASARAGLRRGAFIAAAAVRSARAAVNQDQAPEGAKPVALDVSEAAETLDQLRTLRRLTGNLAGNVNDIARHANSTGELAPETAAVLEYLRTFNRRLDAELMGILRRLR